MSSARKRLTPLEYIAYEQAQGCKCEFFQGEVFAMTGGTPNHSLISANFIRAAGQALEAIEGSEGAVYSGDLRIKSHSTGLYTYADASIVCGAVNLDEAVAHTVTNPIVLVEVLSESTEKYDRGIKASSYRKIDSLQELVLISQYEPVVERFVRRPDGWLMTDATQLDQSLRLESVSIEIALAELYRNVVFQPRES